MNVIIVVFTVFMFGSTPTETKVFGTVVPNGIDCSIYATEIIAEAYKANPKIEDIEFACGSASKVNKT